MSKTPGKGRNERVYDVVRAIPRGRLATYGQVARLAGLGPHARQVGYALHALPEHSTVPWHRVVNAKGRISPRGDGAWPTEQRFRIEREGIAVAPNGAIDLARYQWGAAGDA